MILVTGGAGFVGSSPIAGLEAQGYRGIAVCDRLGDGNRWRNLAKRAVGTPFLSVEEGIGRHVRDFPARGDPCL